MNFFKKALLALACVAGLAAASSADTYQAVLTTGTQTVNGLKTYTARAVFRYGMYIRGAGAVNADPATQGSTPPGLFDFGNLVVVDDNPSDHFLLQLGTSTTTNFGLAVSTIGVLSVKSYSPNGVVATFGSTENPFGAQGVAIIGKANDSVSILFSTDGVTSQGNLSYELDSGHYRLSLRANDHVGSFDTSKTLDIDVTAGIAEVRNMPFSVFDPNAADALLLRVSTSADTSMVTVSTHGVTSFNGDDETGLVAAFGSPNETVGFNGIVIRANYHDVPFVAFSTNTHDGGFASPDHGAVIGYHEDGGHFRLFMMSGQNNIESYVAQPGFDFDVTAGKAEVLNAPFEVLKSSVTTSDVDISSPTTGERYSSIHTFTKGNPGVASGPNSLRKQSIWATHGNTGGREVLALIANDSPGAASNNTADLVVSTFSMRVDSDSGFEIEPNTSGVPAHLELNDADAIIDFGLIADPISQRILLQDFNTGFNVLAIANGAPDGAMSMGVDGALTMISTVSAAALDFQGGTEFSDDRPGGNQIYGTMATPAVASTTYSGGISLYSKGDLAGNPIPPGGYAPGIFQVLGCDPAIDPGCITAGSGGVMSFQPHFGPDDAIYTMAVIPKPLESRGVFQFNLYPPSPDFSVAWTPMVVSSMGVTVNDATQDLHQPTGALEVNDYGDGRPAIHATGDIITSSDIVTRFIKSPLNDLGVYFSTNVLVVGPGGFSTQDSTDSTVQQGFMLVGNDPGGTHLWSGTSALGTNAPAVNIVLYDANSNMYVPNALHVDTMTLSYSPQAPWIAPPVFKVDGIGDVFAQSTATAAEFALQTGEFFGTAPNPNTGSSDGAIIVSSIKGVGTSTITQSALLQVGSVDAAGHVSNSALVSGAGLYDPTRGAYRGNLQLFAGTVMGAYNRATNAQQGRVEGIGTVIMSGGVTDGGGGNADIVAGISGGYNQNGSLAPGGNAHINFDTGDNLGGDSISNPAISTRTTAGGETLTFSINGEATQTITLGADANALAIANDIQAKVRLLTAADPANQYAYTGFNAQVRRGDNALALVAPGDAVNVYNNGGAPPSVLTITGGTFAPLAGLGLSNGGTETSGSIGTYDWALGQGNVPGSVDAMKLDLAGLHLLNGSYYGDGSHLTGVGGSFVGGTVPNETDFLSSVTFHTGIDVMGTITAGYGDFLQKVTVGNSNTDDGNSSSFGAIFGYGNGAGASNATLLGLQNSTGGGSDAVAVGRNNFAYGTAVGADNSIDGASTVGTGYSNATCSTCNYSGAFGYHNYVGGAGSFAIGDNIVNYHVGSVEIGPSDAAKIEIDGLGALIVPSSVTIASGVFLSSTTQGSVSCNAGTGVLSATCTDQHCTFAAGTLATSCTYTFGHALPKVPDCTAGTNAVTPIPISVTSPSTTQITLKAAAALTGDNVTFICAGAP